MRSMIQADLRAIKFMWIPGWKFETFRAWLGAFSFGELAEWWKYRPWA